MNWISISSGNGLSPIRRQAITWTNVHLLSIGPLGANFNEILTKIRNFSLKKMHLKISSAKWRPYCPRGDELTTINATILASWGCYNRQDPGWNCSLVPSNKNAYKGMFPHSTTRARGRCQKCCISLCSKVFINNFHQMKASSECLNILMYWSKYWVDRLRRTLRRKV